MISVTITGLENVLQKLDRVKNVDEPIMEGLYEAIEMARMIVDSAYLSQGYGNGDFTTEIEKTENGYTLTAYGEDVGFLEFGAGVYTQKDEFTSEVDFPVYSGSWSDVHEGTFNANNHQYWFYGGQRLEGIFPTRGMQEALDFLRNNLMDIVERKCKEWIES